MKRRGSYGKGKGKGFSKSRGKRRKSGRRIRNYGSSRGGIRM